MSIVNYLEGVDGRSKQLAFPLQTLHETVSSFSSTISTTTKEHIKPLITELASLQQRKVLLKQSLGSLRSLVQFEQLHQSHLKIEVCLFFLMFF